MGDIYAENESVQFIFILDEWDYIFHQDFASENDKKKYLTFLRSLLKDRPYVKFVYMTGILPIAKYSSGSERNMFAEYTMAREERFSKYFGFTEKEVDVLYGRYQKNNKDNLKVSRDGLRLWYDEIYYYISNNVADVRNDLALMISGESVPVRIYEYAASSQNLKTKEEIFSAMVVYGFLNYEKGRVSVPNRELMEKFSDMLMKESSLGYVYRLANASSKMLRATLNGDTKTMSEIITYAHNTEVPILSYNNETELSAIINLVYLSARDEYRVEREDKAGKGFVDFIFYPVRYDQDCIILELKIDHTPEEAIAQIREKEYALRFQGKSAEQMRYTGRILAVGISYDRETKEHRCKIEVL